LTITPFDCFSNSKKPCVILPCDVLLWNSLLESATSNSLEGYSDRRDRVAAGAILIIGAHALNLKYSKRCRCCEATAPATETASENRLLSIRQ